MFAEPRVLQCFFSTWSPFGINVQNSSYEVYGLFRNTAFTEERLTILTILSLCNYAFVVAAEVGRLARQHDKEDNSNSPDVGFLVVSPLAEDFRCHVEGRSYFLLKLTIWAKLASCAKIN